MAVNPLLQLAQTRQAAATSAKTAAEAVQTAAKSSLDSAKSAYNQKVSERAVLAQQIDQIRKALQLIDSPADGAALLAELGQKTVAYRNKLGELFRLERLLNRAKVASARAGLKAAAARTELINADNALNEATTSDARRNALKAACGAPPLSQLGANATAALSSPAFTTANNRVQTDIPATLLALAREWGGVEAAVVAAAKKKADDAQAALDAKLADIEKHAGALDRAAAALDTYVKTAKQRFDAALAALAKVGDPLQAPLSQAEIDAIQDAAKLTDRNASAALAKDVATAVATAIGAGTTFEDAPNDPAVQTASGAYTAADKTRVDDWAASIPDATWQLAADFELARRVLDELNAGSAALITAIDNAEASLAAALTAAAAAATSVEQSRGDSQDAQTEIDQTRSMSSAFAASLMRGDAA